LHVRPADEASPAGCTEAGANAENHCSCKGYQGECGQRQDREGPEDRCHQRGEPGLYGVHEPKPAAHESPGEQIAGEAGSEGDEKTRSSVVLR
jgi:hypothetical protein